MSARVLSVGLARFRRDERGMIAAEPLLYTTLLFAALAIIADARMLYQKHAEMWTAGRSAARVLARDLAEKDEADQQIRSDLSGFAGDITVSIDDGQVIVVEITADFRRETIFGVIGAMASPSRARVVMRREPELMDRLG